MNNYIFNYFKFFFTTFLLFCFNIYVLKASVVKKKEETTANKFIRLNSSQNPWRGVGIVEAKNKKCVAVVIGNNILLTSAYCLVDNPTNKDNLIENMVFKSGFQNNFYLIKSQIKSFLMPNIDFPPRYINDAKNSWALLFTSEDISYPTGVIPIYREPITTDYLKSHKIITVGYSKDKPNDLIASIQCSFNESAIKVNNNSFIESKSASILMQNCSDYFEPMIGSIVLSIDKENSVSLIGIISGNFQNKRKNIIEHFNIVVPMTNLQQNKEQNESQYTEEENNNQILNR